MKFVIKCTDGDVSQYLDKIKYQISKEGLDIEGNEKYYIELDSLQDLLALSNMTGNQLVIITKEHYKDYNSLSEDTIEIYNYYRE